MAVEDLQLFKERFGNRFFICYQPGFAEIFSSVNAALVLCCLLYWRNLGIYDGWVFKTIKEMQFETGLSRKQQDKAIDILKQFGVIEVIRRTVPQKRFFRIDMARLMETTVSLPHKDKLKSPVNTNNYDDSGQFITKTTSQTTQKITLSDFDKSMSEIDWDNLSNLIRGP